MSELVVVEDCWIGLESVIYLRMSDGSVLCYDKDGNLL